MNLTLEYYEKNAIELSAKYESARLEHLYDEIKSFFRPAAKLIEVGCGSGRDASRLLRKGFDIYGIDGAEQLLQQAFKLHPELQTRLFHLRLPTDLPFADESFDGFISVACLMHFSNQQIIEILLNLKRVLKPWGTGFVSVPSCRSDVDQQGFDEHGRVFNVQSMENWINLFAAAGYTAKPGKEEADGSGREGINWQSYLLQRF